MTDPLEQALKAAVDARPWLLNPTLPRNDKQTFELGARWGWDARAAKSDDIRITREMLAMLLDGDPRAIVVARAHLEKDDR